MNSIFFLCISENVSSTHRTLCAEPECSFSLNAETATVTQMKKVTQRYYLNMKTCSCMLEHISRGNIPRKELLSMSVSIPFRGKRRIKLVCCHESSQQQRWSRSKRTRAGTKKSESPQFILTSCPCFSKPPQQESPQAEAEPAQAVVQGLSQSPCGKAMGSTGVQGSDSRGATPATAQSLLCWLLCQGQKHNQPGAPAVPAATVQFLMVLASKIIHTKPSQAPTTTYRYQTEVGISWHYHPTLNDLPGFSSMYPSASCSVFSKTQDPEWVHLHRIMQLYSLFFFIF